MSIPTPEQVRGAEAASKRLERDWRFDVNTKEICRNKPSIFRRLKRFILSDKYTIFELYWWVKFHHQEIVQFPYPIESDNLPIKGFPMKYALCGGWTIPTSDLNSLTHGPLASEDLMVILVPARLGLKGVLEQIPGWLRAIGAFITLVGGTMTYLGGLKAAYGVAKSWMGQLYNLLPFWPS